MGPFEIEKAFDFNQDGELDSIERAFMYDEHERQEKELFGSTSSSYYDDDDDFDVDEDDAFDDDFDHDDDYDDSEDW